MHVRFVAVAAALGLSTVAFAQSPNPRGVASAPLGGKTVTIEYGRPALKGRNLDQLLGELPADRIWRAGENQVTTFTTETDVLVGGKKVPAGKYTLYVYAPATGDWALVLSRDPGQPLGQIWDKAPAELKNAPWPHYRDYQKSIADKEVVRAAMKPSPAATPADLFTITLKPTPDGAGLTLAWGEKTWSLDLKAAK
ncbi:MAG TPA: DUF2911 domain-containing protein [Vicinamibacteria bacterium]|nr:DUF2911 domain-containing protein [Vicinamibacteria bacterium]